MDCTICGKPIILVPSAQERAKKFGGKPSDYTRLFTEHTDCFTEKRERETRDLVRRLKKGEQEMKDIAKRSWKK